MKYAEFLNSKLQTVRGVYNVRLEDGEYKIREFREDRLHDQIWEPVAQGKEDIPGMVK